MYSVFCFQAEDGIRYLVRSRGLGDVYKRQVLKYCFFTNANWKGSAAEVSIVRSAFNTWKAIGIGLEFQEMTDLEEAEIRIGFLRGDGAWSYVGREILTCLLYTSPSPRDRTRSRMPSSA